MDNRYKERLVTRQSIYIDSKRLLEWLYGVRWKVNRRDRAYLFDTLLIPYVLSMIAHFCRAFQFREERLHEIDLFLFDFDRVEGLIDMASSKKILSAKQYSATIEWTERIRESIKAWRASARKSIQPVRSSNEGARAETEDNPRGGDGLI